VDRAGFTTAPPAASKRIWRFAGCELDESRRQLRVRGQPVDLEEKPLEVLRQLLLRPGDVVTKEELLTAVWPGLTVVDGSLTVAMSKLRKALGEEQAVIVTRARVGYRLDAAVQLITPGSPTVAEPPTASAIPDAPQRPRTRNRRVALAMVAALAAITAIGVLRVRSNAAASLKASGAPQVRSIAVLPLTNMSGDPSADYLAEGMTEALITELSKIRALRVISRTSAMQYKGLTKPLPQIARELNVDAVVEGSVAQSGDRLRVTAQLIHGATDTHLWADSYDREFRDILNLQRRLAQELSHNISVTVQPSEDRQLTAAARVDPRAHELYLRGRFFWNRRTGEDLQKAADYFREAKDIDPNYALAYAGLADAYVEMVGFGHMPPAEGTASAKAAALKAIQFDESLAEPHTALAYAYGAEWNWTAAEKEFQRALDLNPGYVAGLYQYGFILSLLGQHERAIPLIDRAVASDPLSPIVLYRAGRVYYHARRFDKARELFERILELNPRDPLGLYGVGLVYQAEGKTEQALQYLGQQDMERGFDVAATLAVAGNTSLAKKKLDDVLKRLQREGVYVRPGWIAEVYVALGQHDEALRWLERGYQERDAWLALLKIWPPFDPLRSDLRFQQLLGRMNFPM
jgi:TolB-like protein/DNA-binding winged helix-turn-helix (wHTH) protein/Tfp pilus assembly protein PilF